MSATPKAERNTTALTHFYMDSPWTVLVDAQNQWIALTTIALIFSVKQDCMQKLAATRPSHPNRGKEEEQSNPLLWSYWCQSLALIEEVLTWQSMSPPYITHLNSHSPWAGKDVLYSLVSRSQLLKDQL